MASDLFVSDDEEITDVPKVEPTSEQQASFPDEDDPVVEEIPMYASTGLDLHLYQYPTRSAREPFIDATNTGIRACRFKPKTQFVEVDTPLGSRQFYDNEKSEKWGNVQYQAMGGVMKSDGGPYLLGVLKDSELHLNKVNSVVQLRPQFQYFDRYITEEREVMKNNRAEPKTGEPRAIQMSARSASDLAPKFSGALMQKKEFDEEKPLDMAWYDRDSNQSWNVADGLFAVKKDELIANNSQDDLLAIIEG